MKRIQKRAIRRSLFAAAAGVVSLAVPPCVAPALADQPDATARLVAGCITAAADVYRLPPAMLVILLNVEGGSLGRVSQNSNDTVDIGPMQVNQIWVPQIAAHWHASPADTYRALRDAFCPNVEAGAWILRQGLDAAHGDFWEGVGYYHSHDPALKTSYLRSVLAQALRLRASAAPQPSDAAPVGPAQGRLAQGRAAAAPIAAQVAIQGGP